MPKGVQLTHRNLVSTIVMTDNSSTLMNTGNLNFKQKLEIYFIEKILMVFLFCLINSQVIKI